MRGSTEGRAVSGKATCGIDQPQRLLGNGLQRYTSRYRVRPAHLNLTTKAWRGERKLCFSSGASGNRRSGDRRLLHLQRKTPQTSMKIFLFDIGPDRGQRTCAIIEGGNKNTQRTIRETQREKLQLERL